MQTIIVDMTPGFRMPTIYYSQGDVGTQFAIDLRSRFGDSFPTGTTVTIQATKPSGFGFSVAATSVTNGVATFTTTAEMTDEFGRFPAELKVTKTGLTLFTANFYMDGERNTHPEGTTDGSQETVIPELTQLVERVEDAASSVLDMTVVANTLPAGSDATYSYDEETNTATFGIPKGADGSLASGVLAPTYSSSSTYAVGDYVYYSGSLYRCTTAITTAEAWTSGHWTQVALAPEVSDLKRAITDIIDRTGITQEINFTTVPNVAHVSSDDQIYLKVKQGETVRVRSVTSDNSDIAIMAWFTADDYIAYRTNGNEYRYTAAVDSDHVGIYIGPQSTAYNVTTYVTLDGHLDELAEKVEMNSTSIEVLNGYVPIESGSYSDTDGKTKVDNNTRYRCKSPVEIDSISEIVIPSGYQAWVYMLDENLGLITTTQWVTGSLNPQTFSSYGNVKYITFAIKKTSAEDTDISSEINTVKYSFATTTVDSKNIADTSANLLAMVSSAEESIDIYATSDGWRLNPSTGYCYASTDYKLIKYAVTEGILVHIESDDAYQFQSNASVPGSGVKYVVGNPQGVFDGLTIVPTGATFLIFSTLKNGGTAKASVIGSLSTESDGEIVTDIRNARHVPNNTVTPLTLLHFSDIHADTGALERIINDADKYADYIDDMICTGDMCLNTYEQITSWWNPHVMTCIGNHDTASDPGGVYDWTALSMANRDAYYIAPFESNWSITHTSGTSYYYKDYNTAKVRLIVMDGMLYMDDDQTLANAQTAWMNELLSSAITDNLHVLIAIHAPHGGAEPVDCSFTKYGQTTRPVYADCNTPQSVIDAVNTAITNGLHFIGYIVGHSHVDTVWDAENNGKQLMYCITTANTSVNSMWNYGDMARGAGLDAFNLVTIDTAHTLIKIVRGGGADIDDHMRPRKAVCFNYSTGEVVGQIL